MTRPIAGMTPSHASTLLGVLFLILIVGGLFAGPFVRDQLVVMGDAAATASNILENEFLYRLGFAVSLVYLTAAFIMIWMFHGMLRWVNRDLAMLALIFGVVATAIEAVNLVNHMAPLRLLSGTSLSAFDGAQIEAIGHSFLRVFSTGLLISLVYFSFFCMLAGYLIVRCGFLPRILGAFYVLAGLCYVVNSFSWFLAPAVAGFLFPYILFPAVIAPFSFAFWFLFKGIDIGRWNRLTQPGAVHE